MSARNEQVELPERYWPRGGTDVTWDPVVLRVWLEMHQRSFGADTMVNAGVVLFLLDEWEKARTAEDTA